MHPSQTREQRSTKTEKKHGQREILESRDIRQVPNKRRVEVQSQNRDLLIRDVCTCLAGPVRKFEQCVEVVGESARRWRWPLTEYFEGPGQGEQKRSHGLLA